MWISLHIPKVEEGDHKRSDKIGEILTLLTLELLGCNGYLSQYLNYYLARAKLLLLVYNIYINNRMNNIHLFMVLSKQKIFLI